MPAGETAILAITGFGFMVIASMIIGVRHAIEDLRNSLEEDCDSGVSLFGDEE
jgi:hypothetical protein